MSHVIILAIISGIIAIIRFVVQLNKIKETEERNNMLNNINSIEKPSYYNSTTSSVFTAEQKETFVVLKLFYNACQARNLNEINTTDEIKILMEIAEQFEIKDYDSAVKFYNLAKSVFKNGSN